MRATVQAYEVDEKGDILSLSVAFSLQKEVLGQNLLETYGELEYP